MTIKTLAILFILMPLVACNDGESQSSEEAASGDLSSGDNPEITLTHNEEASRVDISFNGQEFISYLYSDTLHKPVLHPIKTATGTAVTRGYPLNPRPGDRTDHPHHVGLWLNYGDVNGLDFWNNSSSIPEDRRDRYGTIIHKEVEEIESEGRRGRLSVSADWVNSDREPLLSENTTFVFEGAGNVRIIDRITTLTAQDQDVSLKDNKEGMLGIRVARELEHPTEDNPEMYAVDEVDESILNQQAITGLYRSSEGIEGEDVWGTRGKWMKLSGEINEEEVTLAILDHPDNTGYPTYWHARGYGLFAANPLGQEAMSGGENVLNFELPAGNSVTFRHRILVISGNAVSDEQLDAYWEDFSEGR